MQVHIAESSDVADHCRTFALSDMTGELGNSCLHKHDSMCQECEQLKEVINDLKDAVEKETFSCKEEERDNIVYKLDTAEKNIFKWKAHLLRSRNQDVAKKQDF